MNNHPYIILANAQNRFNEMLQQAETERLFKQGRDSSVNLQSYVGEALIAVGQKLKTQRSAKSAPTIR